MTPEPKVLIVDDEPKICQFLEVLLRREGYQADSVYNVADAMTQVNETTYDLVITDLKLPGTDGFELVRRLKESHKDLPIIMITGYATVETAVKALRHGVDDYVTKPFNIDELRKVVARTIRSARVAQEDRGGDDRLETAAAEPERHRVSAAKQAQHKEPAPRVPRPTAAKRPRPSAMPAQLAELPTTEHDRDRLLKRTLRAINEKLEAQCSSVMIREGDFLAVRASEGERMNDLIGTRQLMGKGIAGYVARAQRAFVVRDVRTDRRFRQNKQRPYRTPSFLCVPILYAGRTLGVINVGDKQGDVPFVEEDLQYVASAANQIAPALNYADTVRSLQEKCLAVIEQLADVLESKTPYTRHHSQRVARLACALGRVCGIPEAEIELLRRAASVLNLGKIAVGADIIEKRSPLTGEELERVRAYPAVSERMAQSIEFMRPALPTVRHYHERIDGRGYPDGLRGEEIPRLARILSIADAYVAMTSDRPHRHAITPASAADELQSAAGAQFDPALTKLFCEKVLPEEGEA